jgi:hypothetical protein
MLINMVLVLGSSLGSPALMRGEGASVSEVAASDNGL